MTQMAMPLPRGAAILSEDGKYRTWLERPLGGPIWPDPACKLLVVIGANPSTADAIKDDQTMTKEQEFGRRWGCSLLIKVNMYGFRAKDPKDMWAARTERDEDIVGVNVLGRHNDSYILEAVGRAVERPGSVLLGAWGKIPREDRVAEVVTKIIHKYPLQIGSDFIAGIQCLGMNKDGSPKHTLYLPYETPLQPWTWRRG